MKNVALKISALLTIIWYCFSIIGFDVHTCKGSGDTFVATFISGMTCEDIHPEHICPADHCCGASHHSCCGNCEDTGVSVDSESCCDDDIKVLCLTGTHAGDDGSAVPHVACHSCLGQLLAEIYAASHKSNELYQHHDGLPAGSGRLSCLQVWRI